MSFIYDHHGQRKYLTNAERQRFLKAARAASPAVYTFCATLAYTGGRISEVLALVPERIDFNDSLIVLPCLKKRRKGMNRAIPVPASLLHDLDSTHLLRRQQRPGDATGRRIWPWSRTTAWKHVKHTMKMAGLSGPSATAKGLRHSFGVNAIRANVPITLVQKWLGHSRLTTTAIYAEAVGDEEREIAERFWRAFHNKDCEPIENNRY